MTAINSVMFKRGLRVQPLYGDGGYKDAISTHIVTGVHELSNLGFRMSDSLIKAVTGEGVDLCSTMKMILCFARASVKGDKNYKPFYPNFPDQVIQASDFELYFNAIVHYYGDVIGARITPVYEVEDRLPLVLDNFEDLKVIDIFDANDVANTRDAMLGMKVSWSVDDQYDIKVLMATQPGYNSGVAIPNKENMAYLTQVVGLDQVVAMADNATDVLRAIVVYSGGDPALNGVGVTKVKIKSMPRRVRRAVVAQLNNFTYLEDDVMRNIPLWKLVFHTLHVGEFANQYPNVVAVAQIARNNGKGKDTFNHRVELCYQVQNWPRLLNELKARPGEFARRLDSVLRNHPHPSVVINAFADVAHKVSTPVLWSLLTFYGNRELYVDGSLDRSFSVKGRYGTLQHTTKLLPPLPAFQVYDLRQAIRNALRKHYETRNLLSGLVYIDPSVNGFTIPFDLRSASASDKVIGRGTKLSVDGDVLRMFTWWKDIDNDVWGGRVDIDLSALLINADLTRTNQVGYYNLRDYGITHSGDFTSAPNGASEFIDVEVDKVLAAGYRYVAMTLNSYTGQNFNEIPEVVAGVMARPDGMSGDVYEPGTVSTAFDVNYEGKMTTPLVFDLLEKKMVWLDLATKTVRGTYNLYNNADNVSNDVKAVLLKGFPQISDLLKQHALSNSCFVWPYPEVADHIFEVINGRLYHNGEILTTEELMSRWI